jgi:predicted dehydrogenase
MKVCVAGQGAFGIKHLEAIQKIPGIEVITLTGGNQEATKEVAQKFGIPHVYDTPEEMFDKEKLDFVDIITDVGTHANLTRMAAERGCNIVCQKPMATSLEEARSMVDICREAKIQLLISENWRWQYPMRQLKRILDEGRIGKPFRARVHFCNSFPVFDNQPFLKELRDEFVEELCHSCSAQAGSPTARNPSRRKGFRPRRHVPRRHDSTRSGRERS